MPVTLRTQRLAIGLSAAAIAVTAVASGPSGTAVLAAVSVCPVVDAPAEGELSGRLSEHDCTLDRLLGGDDRSLVDQYRVRVPYRGRLTARMSGSALNPWLMLMAEDARLVDTGGGGGNGSTGLVEAVVPAGTYAVLVNTADPELVQAGDYTLALSLAGEPAPAECAVGTLAPAQNVSDRWSSTDCRVLDRVPGEFGQGHAHAYWLSLAQPGAVSLSLSSEGGGASLGLYRSDLHYLAGDWVDPDEQRPATLEQYLAAGSYVVLAAQVEPVEATYSLRSAFQAQPGRCASTPLAWGGVRDGNLLDADCRASLLPGGWGQGPVDRFDVIVTQLSQVTVSLESTEFDAVLELYDRQHGLVAESDDWGEGSDSRLSSALPAGTYTLAVRAFGDDERGAYRLRTELDHAGATCGVEELRLGEPARGDLSEADCTVEDFDGTQDPTHIDVYRIALPAAGRLTLALHSSEFAPYLHVRGFASRAVVAGEGDRQEAAVELVLPAGDYVVAANSFGPAVGGYELSASFEPLAGGDCVPADLAPGARTSGTLSRESCHMVEVEARPWRQSYVDRYRLRLPERGAFAATLSSEALTPFLVLFDAAGTQVLAASSGAGEASAATDLPGGTYELWVTSAALNETGAYELVTTFTSQQAPVCDPTGIRLPSRTPGTLTGSECPLFDIVGHGTDPTRMAAYRVTVPERGILRLQVTSSDFDATLWLFVPSLSWSYRDDDSGGNRNAALETWLEPGTYLVGAAGLGPDAVGSYVLDAAFVPDHQEPPGPRTAAYLPLALAARAAH